MKCKVSVRSMLEVQQNKVLQRRRALWVIGCFGRVCVTVRQGMCEGEGVGGY